MTETVDILQIWLTDNLEMQADLFGEDVGRLFEDWRFKLGTLRVLHLKIRWSFRVKIAHLLF